MSTKALLAAGFAAIGEIGSQCAVSRASSRSCGCCRRATGNRLHSTRERAQRASCSPGGWGESTACNTRMRRSWPRMGRGRRLVRIDLSQGVGRRLPRRRAGWVDLGDGRFQRRSPRSSRRPAQAGASELLLGAGSCERCRPGARTPQQRGHKRQDLQSKERAQLAAIATHVGGSHVGRPVLALRRPQPGRADATRERHGACLSHRELDAPLAAHTCR